MIPEIHAFVDEFGNANLDTSKKDVSTFFIISAVLVDSSLLEDTRRRVEAVRLAHFQTGELKSSTVGQAEGRRIRIFQDLVDLPFKSYSFAVDKRELSKEGGLAYKRSFFKNLNRRLYERLYRAFEHVRVVADEHGSREFMEGFAKYVQRHLPLDLFARRSFAFAPSKSEPLLQLADFISGSFARVIEPDKVSDRANEIDALLARKAIGRVVWPSRRLPPAEQQADAPTQHPHDDLVRRHCERLAEAFLNGGDPLQAEEHLQRAVVEFLLFHSQFVDEKAFIPTGRILDYLRSELGSEIAESGFRTTVIGPLRDADVIIASGPKGYKLPVSAADIAQFVGHATTIVPPMLGRLRRARKELYVASMGELDIMDGPHLAYLRAVVDVEEG